MTNKSIPVSGVLDHGKFTYFDMDGKEVDMTKPTQATDVLPERIVCPDCGHDVFQWHERGTMTRNPDNTLHISYTELAGACQNCHHVLVLPIQGVIDYQA